MYINNYEGLALNQHFQRINFHTHTGTGPNTCGSIAVEDVLSEYQQLGYGGICISNHNLYTDPSAYQNRYDMCLLHGYEYTMGKSHMVCVGTKTVYLDSMQGSIDSTVSDGGFVILCHPNWKYDWSLKQEVLDDIHGFAGVEIYNGSIDCGVIRNPENSNGRCNAPEVYDYLLSQGRLCWCFGNDDFHRWWSLGLAWNMIYSKRTEQDFMAAVKRGAFYVSTGLFLERMDLIDNCVYVHARNHEGYQDINYYRFIGKGGNVLAVVRGKEAKYTLAGDEMYVRVEAMNTAGKMLFTQPIYDKTQFIPEVLS